MLSAPFARGVRYVSQEPPIGKGLHLINEHILASALLLFLQVLRLKGRLQAFHLLRKRLCLPQ
jgi:hypothetical protein